MRVKCWGDNNSYVSPPFGIQFVALTAGAKHFCGIRGDNHGVECWGVFNSSSVPKGYGFMAIASSDIVSCGIREDDWFLIAGLWIPPHRLILILHWNCAVRVFVLLVLVA
ncbi:hypothetical protein SLA2020_437380 [Shorea laevis]